MFPFRNRRDSSRRFFIKNWRDVTSRIHQKRQRQLTNPAEPLESPGIDYRDFLFRQFNESVNRVSNLMGFCRHPVAFIPRFISSQPDFQMIFVSFVFLIFRFFLWWRFLPLSSCKVDRRGSQSLFPEC